MEKPPIESVEDAFKKYHAKVKALLDNKYDEQKVNGCMSLQAPGELEKIYNELKMSLENAQNEKEKDDARNTWLEKYDVMKDITY
ncbi:MAG: hypothetical protein A2271_03795 [Candidatus Moranbacteria bacterium RIFOXYA12_FULL_35_19]|nr:MAG: hypothetical protein UR78_C0003G0029 [Candidatus Moranbacteria bacterium GW2011_GWF2_35_39]OGI33354.1 MAG: hypothetical protein A2489_03820 [Candidatus Moranbacteria bacterium RIFOXYC12_FULL_36_13]OGI36296.1 MAG: hypothetical protein A2271_03795 [Candidatus Moranbacteria bacterium RIFOXYA12_FULL_35_19]